MGPEIDISCHSRCFPTLRCEAGSLTDSADPAPDVYLVPVVYTAAMDPKLDPYVCAASKYFLPWDISPDPGA